jgi:hypothetical protein
MSANDLAETCEINGCRCITIIVPDGDFSGAIMAKIGIKLVKVGGRQRCGSLIESIENSGGMCSSWAEDEFVTCIKEAHI